MLLPAWYHSSTVIFASLLVILFCVSDAFCVKFLFSSKKINLKKNIAITAGASAPDHIVINIVKEINPSETLYLNPINESEYFPLPKELRTNVRNICKFLENLNLSDKEPEKFQGIQNDRNWSATEALASL